MPTFLPSVTYHQARTELIARSGYVFKGQQLLYNRVSHLSTWKYQTMDKPIGNHLIDKQKKMMKRFETGYEGRAVDGMEPLAIIQHVEVPEWTRMFGGVRGVRHPSPPPLFLVFFVHNLLDSPLSPYLCQSDFRPNRISILAMGDL